MRLHSSQFIKMAILGLGLIANSTSAQGLSQSSASVQASGLKSSAAKLQVQEVVVDPPKAESKARSSKELKTFKPYVGSVNSPQNFNLKNQLSNSLQSLGPESGGGGGVIMRGNLLWLIDIFNTPQALASLASQDVKASPSRIKVTSDLNFSFDVNSAPNDPAFVLAQNIFASWQALPFDVISSLIHGAMSSPMQWSFTEKPLVEPRFFRPSALPTDALILTAAYYLFRKPLDFTARISLHIWNQMFLSQQAGLLIHETLRQIQIGHAQNFNDESLQKATVIMLACHPSVKLDQYLQFMILNRLDLAESRLGTFGDVTKDCVGSR